MWKAQTALHNWVCHNNAVVCIGEAIRGQWKRNPDNSWEMTVALLNHNWTTRLKQSRKKMLRLQWSDLCETQEPTRVNRDGLIRHSCSCQAEQRLGFGPQDGGKDTGSAQPDSGLWTSRQLTHSYNLRVQTPSRRNVTFTAWSTVCPDHTLVRYMVCINYTVLWAMSHGTNTEWQVRCLLGCRYSWTLGDWKIQREMKQ